MKLINFHAGPGAGKSVLAAYVYSMLKMQGVNCELVTEYAKDEAWNGNSEILKYQPKIAGEQAWRVQRLVGKIDIVITDSPILLASVYAIPETPKSFMQYLLDEHNRFDSINFFVNRQKFFNQVGRIQNEKESIAIDKKIKELYSLHHVEFDRYIEATLKGCEICMDYLKRYNKL